MKALVVRQPWAAMIADGRKTIEVRSWRTSFRGDLLIIAARCNQGTEHGMPRGVTVGLVRLMECRSMRPEDEPAAFVTYQPGQWAWVLELIRTLPPVPIRGMRGVFEANFTPEII
jgi:hypothetical protein